MTLVARRRDHRSNASDAIGCVLHRSRSHDAVIRVYDEASEVAHEHKGRAQSVLANFAREGVERPVCSR